ncbi:unnamed protein product [Calypogeia fissa]
MMMMQAAATLSSCSAQVGAGALGTTLVNTRVKFAPVQPVVSFQRRPQGSRRLLRVRAEAESTGKPSEQYVDYEGGSSVFPAEACEETGEGCDAEGVFKEVAPKASTSQAAVRQKAGPDREYEEYAGEKTVFPGEACEELGGEFCEPEFQKGVFPDKVQASKN